VTHDIDVVRAMAHRVMVMKASRMVESGPLDEVLEFGDGALTPATRSFRS